LAGISVRVGRPLFPDWLLRDKRFDFKNVVFRYQEFSAGFLFFTPENGSPLHLTENPEEVSALRSYWLKTAREHPWELLDHKIAVFKTLLRWRQQYSYDAVGWEHGAGATGQAFEPTDVWYFLHDCLLFWLESPIMKPWFWLLLAGETLLVLFLLSRRFGGRNETLCYARALSWSALVFILGYLPITAAADFRYVYWSVLASAVATVLVIGEYLGCLRARPARAEPVAGGPAAAVTAASHQP
jgi:hypothetical protein